MCFFYVLCTVWTSFKFCALFGRRYLFVLRVSLHMRDIGQRDLSVMQVERYELLSVCLRVINWLVNTSSMVRRFIEDLLKCLLETS